VFIKRDLETLEWSLKTASTFDASLQDKLAATEFLVAYGKVDKAVAAIRDAEALLGRHGLVSPRFLGRLLAVAKRFRRAGVEESVAALGPLGRQLLSNDEDVVLWRSPNSKTLLVVFGSMFNDFWVSYPVLHCMLRKLDSNILYLKDPREMMYLGGLKSFGSSFGSLVDGIRATAAELALGRILVTGFSSGGYPALLAASRLGAASYLGFSVRTDLSPASLLPQDRKAAARNPFGVLELQGIRRGLEDDLLVDLKPVVQQSRAPGRGVLYYGADDTFDAAHATHLADLDNFIVNELPSTKHNAVLTLMADGEFEKQLARFAH